MQQLSLPELGVSALLFAITLMICHAIVRILFGRRLPVLDKKTSVKKKGAAADCPLNEIMGYDFIQIKVIGQTEEKKHTTGSETADRQNEEERPFFYATANTEQDHIPDEPEPQEPVKIIDFTDDDMEVIANEPWEQGLSMEEQRRMADYYESQAEFACDNEEDEMTEQEMEHEAEFEKYCDDYYEMMEKFATTSEDDAALMDLDKDLEESTGSDTGDNNDNETTDESVPDEDDIPEI